MLMVITLKRGYSLRKTRLHSQECCQGQGSGGAGVRKIQRPRALPGRSQSPDRMHHLSVPGWMLRVQPTVMGRMRLADHMTQGEGPTGMSEGSVKTAGHPFRGRVGVG